jgi:hypothetical protein
VKSFIKFNPVRTLASLSVLVQAVLALLSFDQSWSKDLYLLVQGVATALLAVLGTLFVEARSVSTAALEALDEAQKAGAKE